MRAGATTQGILDSDPAPTLADAAAKGKFSVRNTAAKWFIDCITMGALLNTLAFLIIMGILKGQGLTQISENIRKVSLPTHHLVRSGRGPLLIPLSGNLPNHLGQLQNVAHCLYCQLHIRSRPA